MCEPLSVHNIQNKKFVFIKSGTGSGKTYVSILQAIELAKRGFFPILAFNSKNLVHQAYDICSKLLEEDRNLLNISVYKHTFMDKIPDEKFFSLFLKGGNILLTLHTYFLSRGDTFFTSQIQQLSFFFKKKVILIVDEAHEYLKSFESTIDLTHGYIHTENSNFIVNSPSVIKNPHHWQNYNVSNPLVTFERVDAQMDLLKFDSPKQIYVPTMKSPLFENVDFQKIIYNSTETNKLVSETISSMEETNDVVEETNAQVEDTKEVVEETNTQMEESSLSTVKKNSLMKFDPHNVLLTSEIPNFEIGDQPVYENAYVIARLLLVKLPEEDFLQLQNKIIKQQFKILHYNTIIELFRQVDFEMFQEHAADFAREKANGNKDSIEVENLLENQLNNLKMNFRKKYLKENTFSTKKIEAEFYLKQIDDFWPDYCEILKQHGLKLTPYENTSCDINLFYKLMTSSRIFLITTYPVCNGEKILDLNDFKMKVSKEMKETSSNKLKKFKNVGDGLDNDFVESESEEESKEEKSSKLGKIAQINSAPPFTTSLNFFWWWNLNFLSRFENNVIFLSATFENRHLEHVKENFSDQALFLQNKTPFQKLDKLTIFTSTHDYFANSTDEWRQFWDEFASDFWKKITLPSFDENKEHANYCLILLSSETKAKMYFDYVVKNNKDRQFSFVQNRYETDGGMLKFHPEGLPRAKRCIRLASVQSSLAVGLNLQNHKLLCLPFDIYMPYPTLIRHLGKTIGDARMSDIYSIVRQAMGRIARKTQKELDDPQIKANRFIFISKINKYPSLLLLLKEDFLEMYSEVEIIDITTSENLMKSILQRNKGVKILQEFKEKKPEKIDQYFPYNIGNMSDFRIYLFNLLFDAMNAEEAVIDPVKIRNLVFRFFIICTLLYVARLYLYSHLSVLQGECDKIMTPAQLFKNMNVNQKDEMVSTVLQILKHDVVTFLKQKKKENEPFFDILDNDYMESCFQIFEIFLQLEHIQLLMNEFPVD